MTLIKSISGIRGTIGGAPGSSLTPLDIVKFTYAYCEKMKERRPKAEGERYKVVVGKDARLSGDMVEQLVCGTLIACGADVVKAGFASTPTTEMAVVFENADGGIILTASHNPKQWNALKLLNERGEFLNAEEGAAILECAEKEDFTFAQVDDLGLIEERDFTDQHLDAVLALPAVDVEAVRKAGFKVVLDAVNSVGGIIMPRLLERMGVECICINCEPTGDFAHNPEPLPSNLVELSESVVANNADFGILKGQLDDMGDETGAFYCEFPFFKHVYQLEIRDAVRNDRPTHLCLITAVSKTQEELEPKALNRVTGKLSECIKTSLRSRDVYSRYSASQLVLLLTNTSREQAEMVLNRILKRFKKDNPKMNCSLLYKFDRVGKPSQTQPTDGDRRNGL